MRQLKALVFLSALIVSLALISQAAFAHAQLDSSNPPADALLAAPPSAISLTFTESIDISAMQISVVDENGTSLDVGTPTLVNGSESSVTADVAGISIGTYTVSWSNRSLDDGHTLSGSYAFRVGGSSVAPAAASVAGQDPAWWAVFTRWITFLMLAPAIGTLILTIDRRRTRMIQIGLGISLIATALEPFLLSRFPPNNAQTVGISNSLSAQPDGWWIRLIGLLAALILATVAAGRWPQLRLVPTAGLVALSGFALTSHAAARENYAWAATGIAFLHNASVAIWVGGLVLVTLLPATDRLTELRIFSVRALPLFVVAVLAGLVNAGLIFPSIGSVTDSGYGKVLIAKAIVVAVVFGLAAWHHKTIRTAASVLPSRMATTMRAELGLIAVAAIFASTMAMLAPPIESTGATTTIIDLAEPTTTQLTENQVFVRLAIDPGKTGENNLTAWATQGQPLTVQTNADGTTQLVNTAPLGDVQLIRVTFTSLTHAIAPLAVDLSANGDGKFSSTGLNLTTRDWWRASVTVRRTGVATDLTAEMFLRLPDPNISSWDAATKEGPESNSQAETLFNVARQSLADQQWAFFRQNLAGGNGGLDISTQTWSNGAVQLESPDLVLIRMNGSRYLQQDGGAWTKTDDAVPVGPTGWITDYEGATQFQLGNIETINGVSAQIVSFYVPSHDGLAPAFYTWWIDPVTNLIQQEAMVSNSHYMIQTYDWSAPPAEIIAPTT